MGPKFIVTEKAKRPASDEDRCFYCQQEIGDYHKPDCALITKMVEVEITIRYEVSVPAHWGKDQIEFHRNGSSWCVDNALDEIEESKKDDCLCDNSNFSYIEDKSGPFLDEE